jgi:hypothetical protein
VHSAKVETGKITAKNAGEGGNSIKKQRSTLSAGLSLLVNATMDK